MNRWLRAGNFFGKPNEQKAVSGKLLYFCTFFFYNFHTKAHKKAVMSAAQPTDAVVASATPTTVAASTTAVAAATTPATTAGEPVTPTKTPMPPKEKRPEGGPKTPKSKDVIINTQEIPGGGKIEMRANGSILQTNADGSTIETWKDSERRHETTPNGDWMEVKEDGTHIQYSKEQKVKISKFKNGSELQENDDGSTIETDSEGMIIEKMGNIYIEIRTDGSRLQKDGETGISIEKFGDGTTVQVRFQFVCHTIHFMVPSLVHAWFSFVWSWKHLFLLIFMFINFLFSFLFSRAPPKKKRPCPTTHELYDVPMVTRRKEIPTALSSKPGKMEEEYKLRWMVYALKNLQMEELYKQIHLVLSLKNWRTVHCCHQGNQNLSKNVYLVPDVPPLFPYPTTRLWSVVPCVVTLCWAIKSM